MELSANASKFRAMGIEPVSLTYDAIDELKKFSKKHDINFALLSDKDSGYIKTINILNTSIPQDTKYFGVPYPGIMLVNKDGIVVHKFAEEGYKKRPAMSEVLDAAMKLSTSGK